jgi:hypothetical protein
LGVFGTGFLPFALPTDAFVPEGLAPAVLPVEVLAPDVLRPAFFAEGAFAEGAFAPAAFLPDAPEEAGRFLADFFLAAVPVVFLPAGFAVVFRERVTAASAFDLRTRPRCLRSSTGCTT